MKNSVKILILFLSVCSLNTCNEKQENGKKPDMIVEYEVTPIPGGATITYSIPEDPDILYVMAEYERNGEPFTERSSTYKNQVTIEGFNTLEPVSATLYTVSRSGKVKSDPLPVEFTPLESPISLTFKSTEIIPTFGGVVVVWTNTTRTDLNVFFMVDSLGTLVEKGVVFSSLASVRRSFRGFDNVETTFAVRYEDKWGNVSDTFYFTGTPLFEIEIPKPWIDIRALIPYDNTSVNSATYAFEKIWSGIIGNNRYLSAMGSAGSSVTFDFGQLAKLSRMAIWPYPDRNRPAADAIYQQVNVLEFEMWGTALSPSELPVADRPYWLHPFSSAQQGQKLPDHTFMDDWEYLGRHAVTRLDLLGATDDEIFAQGEAGHQFDISDLCGPVRIIRFFPIATFGGSPPPNNYWQICELGFWGELVNNP